MTLVRVDKEESTAILIAMKISPQFGTHKPVAWPERQEISSRSAVNDEQFIQV